MMYNPNYGYYFDFTTEQLEEIENMAGRRIFDEGITKRSKRTDRSLAFLFYCFRRLNPKWWALKSWYNEQCDHAREDVKKPTISFKYFQRLIRRGEKLWNAGVR